MPGRTPRPASPPDREPSRTAPAPLVPDDGRLRDAAARDHESGRNSGRESDETRQATE